MSSIRDYPGQEKNKGKRVSLTHLHFSLAGSKGKVSLHKNNNNAEFKSATPPYHWGKKETKLLSVQECQDDPFLM